MDYVLEFDEFIRSIKQNMDTKFSMFLGAGASVESGVPSAGECIWEWKRDIFISKNPVLAETHNNIKSEQVKRSIQNWLDNQGIYPQLNSEEEYSKYIEVAYKIADDRRKYFQHLIDGKRCRKDILVWIWKSIFHPKCIDFLKRLISLEEMHFMFRQMDLIKRC